MTIVCNDARYKTGTISDKLIPARNFLLVYGEKMRKPSSLTIIIVGILTVLGMLGLNSQSAAYTADYANLGRLDAPAATKEGIGNSSEVRPFRHNIDTKNFAYYEESHIRAIKRIDGEQTNEPNPRRKTPHVIPLQNVFTIIIRGRTCWQRLSVLDSPCLTRIDQLPLDNRPPPAIF